MSNFFKFNRDIEITEYPFDPSSPLTIKAFGGSSFFNINGYAYPTSIELTDVFVLPAGEYEISLSNPLKHSYYGDKLYLKTQDMQSVDDYFLIENTSKRIKIENQTLLSLYFVFESSGKRYLVGEYWSERQEDFGKDYSIQIKMISGGLYERKKEYAVFKGDVSQDGATTLKDLVYLRLLLLGYEFINSNDLSRCDLNNDGVIDATDQLLLRQYLMGMIKLYEREFREVIEH